MGWFKPPNQEAGFASSVLCEHLMLVELQERKKTLRDGTFSGSTAVSKVSLCLQCEIQAVRGNSGFLFAVLQLNTCSSYCAQAIYVSCINNIHTQAVTHSDVSCRYTYEWKWEFVVTGQCECWAPWWNPFCASALNRPPGKPDGTGFADIFIRGTETRLGQKSFFHLLPGELWSSASAEWCEIIKLKLLIRLSSVFHYRPFDNRENSHLFWI